MKVVSYVPSQDILYISIMFRVKTLLHEGRLRRGECVEFLVIFGFLCYLVMNQILQKIISKKETLNTLSYNLANFRRVCFQGI